MPTPNPNGMIPKFICALSDMPPHSSPTPLPSRKKNKSLHYNTSLFLFYYCTTPAFSGCLTSAFGASLFPLYFHKSFYELHASHPLTPRDFLYCLKKTFLIPTFALRILFLPSFYLLHIDPHTFYCLWWQLGFQHLIIIIYPLLCLFVCFLTSIYHCRAPLLFQMNCY